MQRRHRIYSACIIAKVLLFLFGIAFSSVATGPIAPISVGFGAEGNYSVNIVQTPHPGWTSGKITIYSPMQIDGPVPVILFAHGWGGTNHEYYSHILHNLASNGYHVLFAPANPLVSIARQYEMYNSGFDAGIAQLGGQVDSSRIGFIGHSFGGGLLPSLAWRFLVELKWGSSGSFLYPMAPWYSYEITNSQLAQFPQNCHLVMQVFDSDTINDHRMAIDIYGAVNIPEANKEFLVLSDDTIEGHIFHADHSVPTGSKAPNGVEDALDYYGVLRIADALAAWVFHNDLSAKNIIFADGHPDQRFMGVTASGDSLRQLESILAPEFVYPESKYVFPWSDTRNPRRNVSAITHDLKIAFKNHERNKYSIHVFGNPKAIATKRVCFLNGRFVGNDIKSHGIPRIVHNAP